MKRKEQNQQGKNQFNKVECAACSLLHLHLYKESRQDSKTSYQFPKSIKKEPGLSSKRMACLYVTISRGRGYFFILSFFRSVTKNTVQRDESNIKVLDPKQYKYMQHC